MKDNSFKDFILDQLHDLGEISCRPMFGGFGLYQGRIFFGIISQGRLYLKTEPEDRFLYRAKGMEPFRPNGKQTLKTYFEVPPDILEDQIHLTDWASNAIQAAITKKTSHT